LAKTKQKTKGGNSNGFAIRTVNTKADRQRPSVFMRLKTNEAFKGVALFEPDPEIEDNPGYFEYYDHYDKQGNAYVPCAGDRCPFCAANDNPSTRALTVWYFPQAADVKDRIKVFTLNYSTINDIADEAEDEGGILGKVVRIKRLSDKGDYRVKITTDKALTKKEVKEAMALLQEKFSDGLVSLVERQLKAQMERLKAMDALDDDEDDDDELTTSKKGKPVVDDDDDDDDDEVTDEKDDDDDDDTEGISEEEFEIVKVSKKKNSITVEHEGEQIELVADEDEISVADFKKGQTVTVSAEYDDDEETWTLTAVEEAEAEAEEADDDDDDDDGDAAADTPDEEEAEITGAVYEVVKVQEKDEIFDLKNDDGKVKMWLGEGVDVDYDVIKKGVAVKLDAVQDEEGDWIITEISVAKSGKGGKKK
jgi:hypothetical protein